MTEDTTIPERVAKLEARVDGHEDLCAERYDGIKNNFVGINSKSDLLIEKLDNMSKNRRASDQTIVEWKAMLKGFFTLLGLIGSIVGIVYGLKMLTGL